MQAHWANDSAYYRCRFPAEYALANKIDHPRNVFVREREVLPELDAWLATEFAPHRIEATIEQMAAAQDSPGSEQQVIAEAHRSIRESDAKMARYRAAIDAGADVEEISQWINAAKAERLLAEAALCATPVSACMTTEEISAIVERFTSIAAVIRDADPADKAEIYREINLMLTYEPEEQIVRAQAHLSADSHGVMVGWCPRGDLNPHALLGH
jgi:site-specific DNA recombinase